MPSITTPMSAISYSSQRRVPTNIDGVLDARVNQSRQALHDVYEQMTGTQEDWIEALNLTDELANANFARQQNFVIQHHLAKTILSST